MLFQLNVSRMSEMLLSLLIWTTIGNFVESNVGEDRRSRLRADRIRLNKRQLLPMYMSLPRNRNNEDRTRLDKRMGSTDTRVVRNMVKAERRRLDERLASSSLKDMTSRGRADRSRLDPDTVMEMIPMDMKDIYVGSLNETFPIPLYLKASTLVNSMFGVLGGGGLLAGGAALLGATGQHSYHSC